ncbi:MAG: nicotinamide mononucleotide transporter family protein [Escherichia coli]|nr:nicotinamide mononucleotide transporter family protein [Escherichia coli]
MSYSEIAACLAYAVSVWLAARNNVHTWWIGIIGSILYGWVFWSVQLYADVTLQLFFIATSITGWIHWLKGQGGDILPVRRTQASHFFLLLLCAVVVAGGYGFLLHTFTFVWLAVNTLAVPLYMTRGLNLTAGLYFLFWINAWHGLYQWRKELQTS